MSGYRIGLLFRLVVVRFGSASFRMLARFSNLAPKASAKTAPKFCLMISWQYGSISQNATVLNPAHCAARAKPPMPEKISIWISIEHHLNTLPDQKCAALRAMDQQRSVLVTTVIGHPAQEPGLPSARIGLYEKPSPDKGLKVQTDVAMAVFA